ncbi:MAG TPA: RnfH family protein [Usitatibacter sp.]|nr:RnfH family protein [Usitatibacter sp.]
MRISVAIAVPSRQEVVEIDLPEGSTVADAIAAMSSRPMPGGIDLGTVEVGVWGSRVGRDAVLRDGDRVELYRALKADPKDQRRRRARPKPSPRSRNGP